MGTQLSMGQTIPEWFDSEGNHYYLDDNRLFFKHKERNPILLGFVSDKSLIVLRDRTKHTLYINNSYGFNYSIIELFDFQEVIIYENDKVVHIPIRIFHEYGEIKEAFEHYEKQVFLNLEIIDSLQVDVSTHELYSKRVNMFGLEWFHVVKEELLQSYMIKLGRFLSQRRKDIKIYPEASEMFNAFKFTPYREIKVVVVSSEPYNRLPISDGLAFSSKDEIEVPKPLEKIYDGLERDLGFGNFLDANPSLQYWAEQGVLLLNSLLTVEHNRPYSHSTIGWKTFTGKILKHLSENKENLVFLLMGTTARSFKNIVDKPQHLVFETEHPGFAAKEDRKWNHENIFSRTNAYLKGLNKSEILW